jgi:uncharacterized iron-regulated membrane protein
MTLWQQWRDHPEKSWLRNLFFKIHFWVGAMVGAYIFMMSVSGSVIVFRNELFGMGFSVERIVDLHENLLTGSTGRIVNGIGAISLALLCLTGAAIWWPGTKYWRRSLTIEWRAHFARINWDLHSALGFWCLIFVTMWGLSGIYLVFPNQFGRVLFLDPAGSVTFWLTQLHFGRFNWFTEAGWALMGLVPAILAFTGVFICCRRVIFKKPSNPRGQVD